MIGVMGPLAVRSWKRARAAATTSGELSTPAKLRSLATDHGTTDSSCAVSEDALPPPPPSAAKLLLFFVAEALPAALPLSPPTLLKMRGGAVFAEMSATTASEAASAFGLTVANSACRVRPRCASSTAGE